MHAGMKRSNEGISLRYKFRAFSERKRSSAESPAQQVSISVNCNRAVGCVRI